MRPVPSAPNRIALGSIPDAAEAITPAQRVRLWPRPWRRRPSNDGVPIARPRTVEEAARRAGV